MPLALLLFFICAMLASVVLSAATTAAGQATTLKKTEQSYYAVTSAAKLFRDQLDGQTVTITQTKSGDAMPAYTLQIDGSAALGSDATVLQQAAYKKLTGTAANPASAAWNASIVGGTDLAATTFELGATGVDAKVQDAIRVNVTEQMKADGSIEFVFAQDAAGDDSYRLKLTMTPDIDTYEEADSGMMGDASAGSVTRETTVTWWADELQVTGGSEATAG